MVKADLIYNPYVLETNIRFNGQSPRINSLVEKYQNGPLESWIHLVPSIFHDEMNGYDFELDFSGTKLDFAELQKAFEQAKVTDDMVHLFHKNELDEREKKVEQISKLLKWLDQNRNRKFDFDSFDEMNKDLYYGTYPYVIFKGGMIDTAILSEMDVSAENVENIDELKTTDLTHTPILFYISQENLAGFQTDLKAFLARTDIRKNQLFFMISPALDVEKIDRVIRDLGVEKPQIVDRADSDEIRKYLEIYPITDFINDSIKTFRKETNAIQKVLDRENEDNAISNMEIHNKIDSLENIISSLKASLNQFVNKDNLELPSSWADVKTDLITMIGIWRIKKTKITKEDEAVKAALEFTSEIQRLFSEYLGKLNTRVLESRETLDGKYDNWYKAADFDRDFNYEAVSFGLPSTPEIPSISEKLLSIKTEAYVQPKDDIIGFLFKQSADVKRDPVLEITYNYQDWRDYAISVIEPLAVKVLEDYFELFRTYEAKMAEIYVKHLEELIVEETRQKDETSAQLSDEEKKLQIDNDWLVEFIDQLEAVERD